MNVLSLAEFSQLAGFTLRTLHRLLAAGEGPPTVRLSPRRVGILEQDAEAWLRARRTVPPGWKDEKAA